MKKKQALLHRATSFYNRNEFTQRKETAFEIGVHEFVEMFLGSILYGGKQYNAGIDKKNIDTPEFCFFLAMVKNSK